MAHTRQFNDARVQEFPFKPPTMKYIFDNINYKHLYKLYQCCKLFPNKFPLTIINQIEDYKHALHYFFYNNQPIPQENGSKIWLTEHLLLRTYNPYLPEWISKIQICTIKTLEIMNQNLSINEFKNLIHGGDIESLSMGTVINECGISLSLEEIIAYIPFAETIRLTGALISHETFATLAAMERKSKIIAFEVAKVSVEVNPDELLRFMKIHASTILLHLFQSRN